jgi:antitoxin (DNA-binding transcriptional repressor) of toxin-antitoxin stability system
MLVLHVTEAELAKDLAGVLRRVEEGVEIVVERDTHPVAVIRAAASSHRKISECIALLPPDSGARIDREFAKDVLAAVESHRGALDPPSWD